MGLPVGEMLSRVDSRELAEWRAYEAVAGPIGTEWRDQVLADIHEQLQSLNRLTGQAHFTDKNNREGPAPEPEHYPRPYEFRGASTDEDGDDGATR